MHLAKVHSVKWSDNQYNLMCDIINACFTLLGWLEYNLSWVESCLVLFNALGRLRYNMQCPWSSSGLPMSIKIGTTYSKCCGSGNSKIKLITFRGDILDIAWLGK